MFGNYHYGPVGVADCLPNYEDRIKEATKDKEYFENLLKLVEECPELDCHREPIMQFVGGLYISIKQREESIAEWIKAQENA